MATTLVFLTSQKFIKVWQPGLHYGSYWGAYDALLDSVVISSFILPLLNPNLSSWSYVTALCSSKGSAGS